MKRFTRTNKQHMNPNQKTARFAGLIYLIVVLTGIFSLAYVPSQLIVWDNAPKTFQNITESLALFRLSIASSIICYTAFLLLPLVLYQLLAAVNDKIAKLMVILALVSVPISFVNLQNKYAVLSIVEKAGYWKVFTQEQLQSQMMFYLDHYSNGILIVQVFWGLWLFPFGYLVFKSGMLPKILGILLMMGCIGYVSNVIGHTAIPNYSESGISSYITLPASLGEIGICLWLLVIGIKTKPKTTETINR